MPRLKPMMRITVRMWRKRQSWNWLSRSTRSSHRWYSRPVRVGVLVDALEHRHQLGIGRRAACDQSRSTCARRHRVAVARQVAQDLVVQARRFEHCAQARLLASASCANTLSIAAFLLPSRNSMVRYCSDWKPDDGPEDVAELHVLRRRQRLQHRPHLGQLAQDLLAAREDLLARRRAGRRAGARSPRVSSWIISFIHSSATWCWTMNSSSSWCGGSDSGCCADSRRSSSGSPRRSCGRAGRCGCRLRARACCRRSFSWPW